MVRLFWSYFGLRLGHQQGAPGHRDTNRDTHHSHRDTDRDTVHKSWAKLHPCNRTGSKSERPLAWGYWGKSGKTNYVKDELKNKQKVGPKMVPENRLKWDRHLKACFTKEAFLGISCWQIFFGPLKLFGCFLGGSWVSWGSHGRSLDSKTLKTLRFFKVF